MTAYSAAQSTYTNTQDGNSLAQLTAYTVDNSGILQATYDNGHTLMKGQLAIANFNNTAGLIPVGNNSFEMSGITGLQSGDAIFGTANSGNLGAIRSKAVESSNVDLTAELVKLMTLQRQYTANSQAVKVEAATIVDDAIRIGQ
jgi:flagellar hook protein FlgE